MAAISVIKSSPQLLAKLPGCAIKALTTLTVPHSISAPVHEQTEQSNHD